jgi:hypothetical protein
MIPIQEILRTEEKNTSLQYQSHIAISALTFPRFDDQPRIAQKNYRFFMLFATACLTLQSPWLLYVPSV